MEIFGQVGIAQAVWTDGGPEFASFQFRQFLRKWDVQHRTSSPHYPQSNGVAESGVKAVKRLLRRCWNAHRGRLDKEAWTRGVLQHRNTPGSSGLSPAQLVYGRPVRDELPAHPETYHHHQEATTHDIAARRRERLQKKVDERYNRDAKDLPEFSTGTRVRVQDPRTRRWERCGVITRTLPFRRYRVRFDDGGEVERNRSHLRRRYATVTPDQTSTAAPRDDAAPRRPAALPAPTVRPQAAAEPLRRSARTRRPPQRLIEEI